MNNRVVWLNGEFIAEADAHISVRDRGFLIGDGCFETMSCYAGTLFRLEPHLKRLERSLELTRIRLPYPIDEIGRAASSLPEGCGLSDARVRITVSRGVDCEVTPASVPKATVLITAVAQNPVPQDAFTAGWSAVICKRTTHPGNVVWTQAKTTSRLWIVLAAAEAETAGVDEAIMLDLDGRVVEGTRSNIFILRGGVLETPSTSTGALAGITRSEVIEIANRLGLPTVQDRPIDVDDLLTADECFLSRTTAGAVPITSIEGKPIGSGKPGPVTLKIAEEYERVVQSACGASAKVRE